MLDEILHGAMTFVASWRPPTRILTAMLMALALLSSCSREPIVDYVNPALMPQFRLSVTGPQIASAVLERTRELKLTTDGGQTWQTILPAAVADAFECITMLDGRRGWALNHQGQVFSTDSGGETWTRISELREFTCSNQIEFLNDKEGWIRECLSLWRTRDGGVTWQKMLSTSSPGVAGQPTGMFAIDANTVIVSGSGGQVYRTKDGGENWKIHALFDGKNVDYDDVWFVDPKHGWIAGKQVLVAGESSRPLLFETIDGGESWKQISVNHDILPSSICFVGDEGWLAGSQRIVNGDSVRLEGMLLHTTDGGNSWERIQLGPNEPFLTDVRFTDKEHGWVLGRDTVFRTEDSGKTWKRVLSLLPPKEQN